MSNIILAIVKKLFLLVLISVSMHLTAQEHFVGVKGGMSVTGTHNATALEETRFDKTSMTGLTYQYLHKQKIIAETNLLFYQTGFYTQSTEIQNNRLTSKQLFFSYDYLSLPIKIGYKFGDAFFYTAKMGVAPSYLLSANHLAPEAKNNWSTAQKIKKRTDFITEDLDNINISESATKFDVAAIAELGIGYGLKNGINLLTALEFRHSLKEISNVNYFPEKHLLLYGFSFTFGVNYKL